MPTYIIYNTNNNNCNTNNYCRDTSLFFSKLSSKLLDMAMAINKRIESIESKVCSNERGVLLASIETPVMTLGIKIEYLEYVKRYGPPEGGRFDNDKLQLIKDELGITSEASL